MNLRDLEYLVALSEHRHFGRAAAACYVSQPTLSTQIKKLESELGAPLIERGSRGVIFTLAGESVLARARSVLAGADEIRTIARYAADPRSGTLRLGVFPTLGPYLLPHALPLVKAQLPDLRLLLVEEKSPDLVGMLQAGTLDAAVLAMPVDETFDHAPLFREEFVLAVPAGHDLAGGTGADEESAPPVTTDALQGQDVLLLADGHCMRDQALEVCSLAGAAERDGFRATSLETLRHMVAGGVGITLLPHLSVSPPVPASDGLVLRRFADPAPYRDIALVWRRGGVHAGLMTELAAILRGLVGTAAGDGLRALSPVDPAVATPVEG
ncbi:LysR substrate-binding domain-containing protein [Mobilicoccus pelagius]|uniref:Probable hydrogen peroxide-inducible genes activator n=1 Tax=Mobilicoccus pelagius NBRC 104925 TaxID=1089455 RepID=H5URM7_9MICO|nr:LysR substrate-binding domain-containing protein [Mobilicoccus pelagius]GAB48385.1 putative LysR family transcriptional regulator [Mobilicoccus pelagius NBRC 104925]